MPRLIAVLIALFVLTGFSERDAFERFSGGWQMADHIYGTKGALQIEGAARTLRLAQGVLIDGHIDHVEIIGASAIFRVGDKVVVIYSGPDNDTIGVQVGEGNAVLTYVRVP